MSKDYFLASGRWDNVVLVIDPDLAMDPANDGTPNAVVSRLRVTPDIEVDGRVETACGQPITVTISRDQRNAYISNHSGQTSAREAEAYQHGHPGSVTVLDLTRALSPEADGTLAAVTSWIAGDGFGATGFATLPDGRHGVLAYAEAAGAEDGGRHLSLIDLSSGHLTGRVELAINGPPPATLPRAAPDARFGCYPDPNGVAVSALGGPAGLILTANGGTSDISVIDIAKVLAGEPDAETGRIPVQSGGFGISTSPDGTLAAHASRENAKDGSEGNTVSVIDVIRAGRDPSRAEVARVLVGTDDPAQPSRPFVAAFTPDGTRIVVSSFRTGCIDIIDLAAALDGRPATLARVGLSTGSADPSCPRGVAITPDGRFAAVTGGPPKAGPGSSMVWIVDLERQAVRGRVTGIGSESYMIAHFTAA